jgi:hypothetical protein
MLAEILGGLPRIPLELHDSSVSSLTGVCQLNRWLGFYMPAP